MDSVITAVVTGCINLGFGGIMLAVLIYFAREAIQIHIPSLLAKQDQTLEWTRKKLSDLQAQSRDEAVESRQQFLAALTEQRQQALAALTDQRQQSLAALDRLERRWERATEEILARLGRIEDKLGDGPGEGPGEGRREGKTPTVR